MTFLSSDRYALALHSSSQQLGLCLTNFTDFQRYQVWDVERSLSNVLHLYLREFIRPQTWQDLAFIAVDQGPGSFTSTRLGLVTARTLAQQFDLPLFPVSSLAAFARSQSLNDNTDDPRTYLAVAMTATQGKSYGAVYRDRQIDALLNPYLADALFTPPQWQQAIDCLGEPYHLLKAGSSLGYTAPAIAELAYAQWQRGDLPHWSQALPFYG